MTPTGAAQLLHTIEQLLHTSERFHSVDKRIFPSDEPAAFPVGTAVACIIGAQWIRDAKAPPTLVDSTIKLYEERIENTFNAGRVCGGIRLRGAQQGLRATFAGGISATDDGWTP